MHELGIVVHVINQIEELAKKNNVKRVVELTLEVGEVSGVVKEYFVDAFNWAIKKTEYMKECKLNYITIQGITYCEDCGKIIVDLKESEKDEKGIRKHTFGRSHERKI